MNRNIVRGFLISVHVSGLLFGTWYSLQIEKAEYIESAQVTEVQKVQEENTKEQEGASGEFLQRMYTNDLEYLQYFEYFVEGHGVLLARGQEAYELEYEERSLDCLQTLDGGRMYLLPYPLTEFLFVRKGEERWILPTYALEKDTSTNHVFITKDGYFVRADMSYVCSAALTLSASGRCHASSYYLE